MYYHYFLWGLWGYFYINLIFTSLSLANTSNKDVFFFNITSHLCWLGVNSIAYIPHNILWSCFIGFLFTKKWFLFSYYKKIMCIRICLLWLNLLGKDLQGLWCLLFFYHIKLSYGRSARNHYKTVLKCLLTKTIINEEGNNLIGFIFWLIGKYFIWHQNEMFSFTLENWKRNQWKTIIQFLNMRGKNMSFNSESVIITSDSNKSLLSQTAAISMESMDWGNVNTVVLEEVFVVFIGYGTVVTEVQGVVVSNIFRVNGYLFSFMI